MNIIEIKGRKIGDGHAPYLIAEVGINHGGNLDTAKSLVRAAAEAGADAVKLQTYRTEEFLAPSSQYFGILNSAELGESAISELANLAAKLGICLFSSAFDEPSVRLMASLGAPAYKVASGDLTHLPLLASISKLGKPMVVSTGGGTIGEVGEALRAIRESNPDTQVMLMHCVSSYPTEPSNANLACMETLKHQFELPIGFSDHTLGETVAIAAVALGANAIEKHLTLDRSAPGPDHALSSDPAGLKAMFAALGDAWRAVGRPAKAPVEAADFIPLIRRSLNARRDIKAGEVLSDDMVAVRRPGTGIAPAAMSVARGQKTRCAIPEGTTITWDMLTKG